MWDSKVTAAIIPAMGGLVVAVVSGFITYRTARSNIRKDLEVELRHERLDAFKKLWAISQPLAKYGRSEAVTTGVIARLSQDLRRWYFEQGGMFLTEASRQAYFEFQESLQNAMKAPAKNFEGAALDDQTFESLRIKGSELRTALRAAFRRFPQM